MERSDEAKTLRPRDYGFMAFDIWKDKGKDEAVEYIRKSCPKDWQKLAYSHLKTFAQRHLMKP